MEAASYYAYNNKRVCVLNFASATNPGGGVTKGSSAQEEAICRVSTLYPCLNERRIMKSFYYPHRDAHDSLHNDDAVYTPGVVVFKSDTSYPVLLDREKWFNVNVITSAAPNLRKNPGNYMNAGVGSGIVDISNEDLFSLLERRIFSFYWRRESIEYWRLQQGKKMKSLYWGPLAAGLSQILQKWLQRP